MANLEPKKARELLEAVTMPTDSVWNPAPIYNNQRVTVLRDDIKDLNDQVNNLIDLTKDPTLNDQVISLKEITAKLALSSFNESNLKLRTIDSTMEIDINSTNKSSNFLYEYKLAEDAGQYVGVGDITLNIQPKIAILASTNIDFIDKESFEESSISTNINIYSTTINLVDSSSYIGAEQVSINIPLESTEINLNSSNILGSFIVGADAFAFSSVTIKPVLEELTSTSIATKLDSTNTIVISPENDAIGFSTVSIDTESVSTMIKPFQATASTNEQFNTIIVDNTNAQIATDSSTITLTHSSTTVGIKDIQIAVPGAYSYSLINTSALFTGDSQQQYLQIIPDSSNYILSEVIIPKIIKTNYSFTEDTVSSALKIGQRTIEVTAPENTVYENITVNLPQSVEILNSNHIIGTINLTLNIDSITPNNTLFVHNSGELNSANCNLELLNANQLDTNTSAVNKQIAENTVYEQQIFNTKIYTMNLLDFNNINNNHRVIFTFNPKESYNVKVYCGTRETPRFYFTTSGITLKRLDNKLEVQDSEPLNISFVPSFSVNTTTEEIKVTEDNQNSYPDANIGDTIEVVTEEIVPESGMRIAVGSDTEYTTVADIRNFFESFSEQCVDANYIPYVSIECTKQNKQELSFNSSNINTEALETNINIKVNEQSEDFYTIMLKEDTDTGVKYISKLTYNGITYILTKTDKTTAITGLYEGNLVIDPDTESIYTGYTFDFLVTENTIYFNTLHIETDN